MSDLPRFHAVANPDGSGELVSLQWTAAGLSLYTADSEHEQVLIDINDDRLEEQWKTDFIRRWWHVISQRIAADPYGTAALFALEHWRCGFCGERMTNTRIGSGTCAACESQAYRDGLDRMRVVIHHHEVINHHHEVTNAGLLADAERRSGVVRYSITGVSGFDTTR